jgi:2-aminobenzoate-CoA ligase
MATPATEVRDHEAWLPPPELRPQRLYRLPALQRYPAELNVTEELLDRHVRDGRGEHPAIVCGDLTLTYRELLGAAASLGNALRRLGVREGEPVLIHSLNEPQALVANFAVLRLGGIVVPTSPMLSPAALAHIANDAGARVVVVSAALADVVTAALRDCRSVEHVVVFGAAPEVVRERGYMASEELAAAEPAELVPVRRARSAVAVLFYSSGITEPAYAMAHLAEELLVIPDVYGRHGWGVQPDDIVAGAGPIAFAGGYSSAATIPFRYGATSVAIPLDRSTPEGMFELVRRHRVTLLSALPTGYRLMLEAAGDRARDDLASLRVVAGGGESLPPDTYAGWKEHLGHEIYEGFGTNGMFHVFITSAVARRVKPGAIGVALPGYDARALTDEGTVAKPGQLGRLWARGPVGTLFWGPPERAEAIAERQRATVRDGWVLVGDHVTIDEEGFVTFVAREEDLIRRGGRAFGPGQVEAALSSHPAVAEAGVLGVRDAGGGQAVRAYVVLAGGRPPDPGLRQDLVDRCRGSLGEAEAPAEIAFVPSLPRAPHGALLRRVLWERWFRQAGAPRPTV